VPLGVSTGGPELERTRNACALKFGSAVQHEHGFVRHPTTRQVKDDRLAGERGQPIEMTSNGRAGLKL
jgi:hypothetical protein